jgi:hypothetical protein
MLRRTTTLALAIAACINFTPDVNAGQNAFRLEMRSGRLLVEDVYLNGHGPYRFLLDSGAQANAVESGLALDIGLKATFGVEVATVAGVSLVSGGQINELRLGDIEVSGLEFLVHSLDAIHALDPTIRGVLGQTLLTRFDYLIDVQRRSLRFGEVPPRSGVRIDLEVDEGGRILLPTNLGRLALDSGTGILILFDNPRGGGLEARTLSGVTAASSTAPQRVEIAGYRLRSTPAATVARPVGIYEAGLLPIIAFNAIYVSNSGKYVILDPL